MWVNRVRIAPEAKVLCRVKARKGWNTGIREVPEKCCVVPDEIETRDSALYLSNIDYSDWHKRKQMSHEAINSRSYVDVLFRSPQAYLPCGPEVLVKIMTADNSGRLRTFI